MSTQSPDPEQHSPEPVSSIRTSGDGFPTNRHLIWFMSVLLLYFGLRLLYLAVNISPLVPPDEVTHFGVCKIFSTVFFLPENSPASYQYGLVTNIPWLYYWIMGKLLYLNFFGISDLVFLRLLNIPLAFATIYYVWRTLRLLTDDRLAQMLLIVAMTNTMMFTFLSAFVSYDNLANLLAAMALYYLFAFLKERSGAMLTLSFLCQLAGCLTKLTFLPLVLILNIVLIVHEVRKLPRLPAALMDFLRTSCRRRQGMMLALLLGLTLNIVLYGGNYIRYRSIAPDMATVISVESAMQYRLAARGYILSMFKEGRISKEQALVMASRIKQPDDRASTEYTIESYEELKNSGFKTMGLATYIPRWIETMAAGIFGIFAHLAISNFWPTIAPIAFLGVLTIIAFIIRWRPWDADGLSTYLAVIAVFYGAFLMYGVNYRDYLDSGAFYTALQGRYIFPVIGPIYVLSGVYLMRLFKGKAARLTVFALAVFILIVCDFPFFLSNITPEWFAWTPK
jgi:hypothetical protein